MNVVLLAGGNSGERAVSLNSGEAVWQSLVRLGHAVTVIDTANGMPLVDAQGVYLKPAIPPDENGQVGSDRLLADILSYQKMKSFDVACIMLHGGAGENGSVQTLLELAGVPYTGSDSLSSAICMSKGLSKRLVESADVATPGWLAFPRPSAGFTQTEADLVLRQFELPVIVKPNDGGSTIGLTKVESQSQLLAALRAACTERPTALIEEFIAGRELTVSVLDGAPLPIVEITPKNPLYDYEAKYTKGMSNYTLPAQLDAALTLEIQQAAVTASQVLGCRGLVRADFILDTNNEYFFLEVNTLPGMTALSLAPMAAKAAGLSFDQLVDKLLQMALSR